MNKKIFKSKRLIRTPAILLMALILVMCSFGCSRPATKESTSGSSVESTSVVSLEPSTDFDSLTNEVFRKILTQNTINLHSILKNPANYGITDYAVTLGSYDIGTITDMSLYTDTLERLKKFDRSTLSDSQQLTYDQLLMYLNNELANSSLYLYGSQITPTTGIQVSLPIIFAEYSFNSRTDIDNYIELIRQTDEYFKELAEFEKLRAAKGLFMEDSIANKVIDQCNTFLEANASNSEDSLLVSTFAQRIDSMKDITAEDKASLKAANKKALAENLYPAYTNLAKELTALKGTNSYKGGLANYPDGKKYYEYLLKSDLGWSKSVDELNALLDKYINLSMLQITALVTKDSKLADKFSTFSFPVKEPAAILTDLKQKILTDFPEPPAVSYEIKYVDKSLEEYSSPAMYFLPQIDNYTANAIYINKASTDSDSLYSTLAHEGYPGHMYQTTYFNSLKPSPIRSLLACEGFIEGWASYCEVYSYNLADSSNKNLNYLAQANYQAILMIYSKVDLGVNYYGWDRAKTAKFLSGYSITDEAAVTQIYESMIAEPCTYPKYSIGCIGMMEFKNTAQTALGDKFKIKEFHRFLMELGPVPFDLVEKKLSSWIDSQK